MKSNFSTNSYTYFENCDLSDKNFYKFDAFDHDLILFAGDSGRVSSDYENMIILGGRSASPFDTNKLSKLFNLSKTDQKFFKSFISDSTRSFALFCVEDKTMVVFNHLFRACGLGVAFIFNEQRENAVSAIREELFDFLGDGFWSDTLMRLAKRSKAKANEENVMALVYSVIKISETLLYSIGEGKNRQTVEPISIISALSSLSGCRAELNGPTHSHRAPSIDRESLATILLCLFSFCRRFSADRGLKLSVDELPQGYSIKLGFELGDVKPTPSDISLISFCEAMSNRLELPFFFEMDKDHCSCEFMPRRVDPALSGLKAGVHIKFEI